MGRGWTSLTLGVALVFTASSVAAQSRRSRQPAPPPAPVDYPYPLITEVLFDVPEGAAGDASGDGQRHATGDEFIEVTNPHDRSISLGGYILSDRNHPGRAGFSFQFPALKLKPGESAVVFNGLETRVRGSVGTTERRARASREFAKAYVFTAQNDSGSVGLANSGDWVLLSTHRGRPIHCVYWGEFEAELPQGPGLLIEQASRETRGSVHRAPASPPDADHEQLGAWSRHHEHAGLRFSPGQPLETEPEFEPADDKEAGEPADTTEDE